MVNFEYTCREGGKREWKGGGVERDCMKNGVANVFVCVVMYVYAVSLEEEERKELVIHTQEYTQEYTQEHAQQE